MMPKGRKYKAHNLYNELQLITKWMRTCLKAYIAAILNASSLESTAWDAPSVKTTRRYSTGCPIKEPLYIQVQNRPTQNMHHIYIYRKKNQYHIMDLLQT